MSDAVVYDETNCSLGEGALWHPKRRSLFWFDINKCLMCERAPNDAEAKIWQFDEHVSAAGWVDEQTLLIASETALFRFDLETGESAFEVALEAENPVTRSNDGRADPQGGFWIGTMGKNAEAKAGAIYRYYDGELRKLYDELTITNSICFSPDGHTAYFCDTMTKEIMQVTLDEKGWPVGEPRVFADVAPYSPDGSVVDASGNLWNAQWGSNRVACYDQDGKFVEAMEFPASQISCPALGGKDFTTLFVTSANEHMENPSADEGRVYRVFTAYKGQQEHQVKLG